MQNKWAIIVALLFFSCQQPTVSAGSASGKKGVPGLIKSEERADVSYVVEFLPGYQRRADERLGRREVDSSNAATVDSILFFRFNIRSDRFREEKELVQYMNYRMQQDFSLHVAKDSIPCSFYQPIPRNSGREFEFIVAFEMDDMGDDIAKNMDFVFHDRMVNNATILFPYTPKDFSH